MRTLLNKIKQSKYKHCLWSSCCANFIKEQKNRFVLLDGKPCLVGTMYFCDTYLEAMFVMEVFKGTALYSDECSNGSHSSFVVVSKKRFK